MKLTIALFLAATLAATAQTSSQTTIPAQGQVQVQQNNNANPPVDTFPPGLQDRPLPPGLRNRPLPPGLANRTNGLSGNSNFANVYGTNFGVYLSNQFVADSNAMFGTNRFGYNPNSYNQISNSYNVISNTSNLLPTGYTNTLTRLYGSNALSSNFRLSDQTFSDTDKSLLLTLRQSVATQLGVTPTGMMPVHFYIRNGVVTLVGFVNSPNESQRVALLVQQTPGVVSVVNDLQVTSGASGIVEPMGGTLQNGSTTPITVQPGVTATNYLPPTGATNGVDRDDRLPPGLEKREQLPPGLQNREALPPGLERRTNDVQ